jgi:hypothetical protein
MSTKESIELDGQRAAAEILSRLPSQTRTRLIESIRVINPRSALRLELSVSDVILEQSARDLAPKKRSSELAKEPSREPIRELALSTENTRREPQAKATTEIIQTHQQTEITPPISRREVVAREIEATGAKVTKSLDAAYPEEDARPVERRRFGGRVV